MNSNIRILFAFLLITTIMQAQHFTDITICVNPGHGGYDSDDRNMTIFPYSQGDKNGFWESKSNLDKAFHLRDLLKGAGVNVIMTRTTNEHTEAGGNCDTPLSAIVEMANANNSDYMLSIHTNAGGNNMVLMLYSGVDDGDTYNYSHTAPFWPESKEVAVKVAQNLFSNKVTQWTGSPSIRGDKTFARLIMEWSNGYGVLRNLIVPGMISEGAMHDYIPETYRLMNPDYKKLEAWHFFKSFCQQYNAGQQNIGKIAGWIKDDKRSFLSAFPGTPNYWSIPGSTDSFKPLNGAKVTLIQNQLEIKSYNVDNMYNGFFAFDSLTPGNYKLKVENPTYTTKIVEVEVKPFEVTYSNCLLELNRSNNLAVEEFYPNILLTDSVAPSVRIKIKFNFELNRSSFESAFSLTPVAPGKFEYSNFDRTVVFIPNEPLQSQTIYSVQVDKSAKHIDNVPMLNDIRFTFKTTTKRYLELIDWYPKADAVVYPNTQIRLVFDTPIVLSGMNSKVYVTDSNGLIVNGEGVLYNDISAPLGDYQFRLPALTEGNNYTLHIDRNVFDADTLKLRESKLIPFNVSKLIQIPTESLKDNFETINKWKIDSEKSVNLSGINNMVRYSSIKYDGSYSYRLLYKFSSLSAESKIKTYYRTPAIDVQKGKYLGVYVFGDLSFNQLELLLTLGTDTIAIPLKTLDYAGWKFIETGFDNLPVNIVYKLLGIQLSCTGLKAQSIEGGVMFDNLAVYDHALTSIRKIPNSDNIKIYPNPASYYIRLICIENTTTLNYRILSISGQVVKTECANLVNSSVCIDIQDLSKGIYILQSFANDQIYVRRFVKN